MSSRKESEERSQSGNTNTISRKDWVAEAVAVAKRVTKERERVESDEAAGKTGLTPDCG